MNIHDFVEKTVRKYHTRDPYKIAREKNVLLVFAPLIDVRGFFQYFQRNNIIYIDETLPEHEQQFVCAHELGHMHMHKSDNFLYMDTKTCFNTNKYEIEANTFAVNLLIPDEVILENYYYTVGQLSRILGYEKALIELRLKSYREI